MTRLALGPFLSLVVLGVLAVGPAVGDEPAREGQRPDKAPFTRPGATEEVAVPQCLQKLTLTAQQQEQIERIVREYDGDLATVWKQFGDRYLETVRTEALLLSAIEDNLTEPQRNQVREQRRITARHEKRIADTDVKPNTEPAKPASAVENAITIVGVALTVEQQMAADALQEKYLGRLRSLNRDIQGLHMQLVSLEADKLVQIEGVLTKEQMKQLRESRRDAPVALADKVAPARSR